MDSKFGDVPVAKAKVKAAPKQNPFEVPLYTPWDVARYLRIPLWAVAILTGRFRGWLEPEFFFERFWHDYPPPLLDEDLVARPNDSSDHSRISFRRFANLFVRAGVFYALAEWSKTLSQRSERLETVHRAIWRGVEDTQREPVAFHGSPSSERAERLAAPFVQRLEESQATLIKKHLTLRLDRVEAKDGVPVRIFPPSRDPTATSPRMIVLDPRVRFGRPTLAGRGLPTDSLFERYLAGESVAELAADYDVSVDEVDEAIRYESHPLLPFFPFSGW